MPQTSVHDPKRQVFRKAAKATSQKTVTGIANNIATETVIKAKKVTKTKKMTNTNKVTETKKVTTIEKVTRTKESSKIQQDKKSFKAILGCMIPLEHLCCCVVLENSL